MLLLAKPIPTSLRWLAAALLWTGIGMADIGAQSPNTPQTNLVPINPPASTYAPPSPSGFGQFDPYAQSPPGGFGGGGFNGNFNPNNLGPGVTAIGPPTPIGPPTTPPAPSGGVGGFFDRMFSSPLDTAQPPTLSPSFGAPASGPVWGGQAYGPTYGPSSPPYDNPNVYGSPNPYGGPPAGSVFPSNPFPSTAYPSQSPSTLFPGGIFSSGGMFGGIDPNYSAYRLLRGPRIRHTYIGPGDNGTDLEINDTDLSVVFAFPNFLYSQQPLYVVPSFSLHLWDGPEGPMSDLPSRAYSGFIDTGWQSDPNQMFGTEFGVRVGAFTDFETFESDSIRVMGKGLVHFRLTPASTLKAGVYYLDRKNVKLVPAGGILWQPNPYTRADIFFPEPKFSRYCRTVGTSDVWWYVTGAYGGGEWTIKRTDGAVESVDINDFRVMTGFEWGDSNSIRTGRRTAFAEIGYVFDRDVEYVQSPQDDIRPDDAFLFRIGLGY